MDDLSHNPTSKATKQELISPIFLIRKLRGRGLRTFLGCVTGTQESRCLNPRLSYWHPALNHPIVHEEVQLTRGQGGWVLFPPSACGCTLLSSSSWKVGPDSERPAGWGAHAAIVTAGTRLPRAQPRCLTPSPRCNSYAFGGLTSHTTFL